MESQVVVGCISHERALVDEVQQLVAFLVLADAKVFRCVVFRQFALTPTSTHDERFFWFATRLRDLSLGSRCPRLFSSQPYRVGQEQLVGRMASGGLALARVLRS